VGPGTLRRWAAILLASSAACRASPSLGSDTSTSIPQPTVPQVQTESPSGRVGTVRVELARTPAEQERGLMFREKMGADEGMLFIFQESSEHTFWMKNTILPLDMIFADGQGMVVGVVRNAEPQTLTPRTVGAPSRYVLEVNAGWSAAHGVEKGARLRFLGFTP
jgi:uncharacterized membrane protein (UPF0127 family)